MKNSLHCIAALSLFTVSTLHATDSIVVTTLVDEDNGTINPAQGTGVSLREAIRHPGSDPDDLALDITFAPELAGETIWLTLGQLTSVPAMDFVRITGPITISRHPNSPLGRILEVPERLSLTLDRVRISGGNPGTASGANGGGILLHGGLELYSCELIGNRARNGGGLFITAGGEVTAMVDSVFDGNIADIEGGAIDNRGLIGTEDVVVRCTFSGNSAVQGGGAIQQQGTTEFGKTLRLDHCTLSGNTAQFGGAIDGDGASVIELFNCTITNNSATKGGGIEQSAAGGEVHLHNSIVAGNSAPGPLGPNQGGPDLYGPITGQGDGSNLIGSLQAVTGTYTGLVGAPLLGPLADNGGATQTQLPLPGSPAIDAGGPGGGLDQRGLPRVIGAAMDLGSVEYQTADFTATAGDDILPLGPDFGDLTRDGLGGFDTVVFPPGIRPQDLELTDTSGPDFFIQVGESGSLSLSNFERLQFADGTLISLETLGEVMTWGAYLDESSQSPGPGQDSFLPSRVSISVQPEFGPPSLESVIAVDAGGGHALAVSAFGRVFAWGENSRGQLGIGTTVDHTSPQQVDLSGALDGKRVIAVAAGEDFSLALTDEGKVYAWGGNQLGQLGNGTTTDSLVPVAVNVSGALSGKTITQIAAGTGHALALSSDGKVFSWGDNSLGQLGIGSAATSVLVPTAVVSAGVLAGKSVTAIAAGDLHSLALDDNGHVYSWGYNVAGQLGDGSTTSRSVPIEVDRTGPLGGQIVNAIAAGGYHSLTATTAGSVVSWGLNASLQLGVSGELFVPVPVAVPMAGTHVTKLAAGLFYSVALTDDGKVFSWGENSIGQLGIGQSGENSLPVEVEARGWLAGRPVRDIAAGNQHSIALTDTVYLEPDIEVRNGGSLLLNDGPAVILPTTVVGQTSENITFGVLNNGRVPLGGFSVSLSGDHPGDFDFDDLLFDLGFLNFAEVLVHFQPQAAGLRRATLEITSNDPNESPFLVNLEAQANPDDCPGCAVVGELDQSLFSEPFPRLDLLVAQLNNNLLSNVEIKQISYNRDISYAYQFSNTVRSNNVTSDFIEARNIALTSGLVVKSLEYNAAGQWHIVWGDNNFVVNGYSALEGQLLALKNEGKVIKQVLTLPDSDSFLILLSDNTFVASGINGNLLNALTDLGTIKRISLSNDQNLAIVRTDGTLEIVGTNFSANQLRFISSIQTEINTNGYQADTIYFGRNKEMIFTARKTGSPSIIRHMGPIREQTEVTTADGNLELIQHLSPNYKYQLYRSLDLVTWQKIGPEVTGDNTFKKFTTPMGPDRGIYRFTVTFAAP